MDNRDREVGRRISALRSGLTSAAEAFDLLIEELHKSNDYTAVALAREARTEIDTALNRELRMRGQDHSLAGRG